MKCDLHWKVWTPSRKSTLSMASGPTVAAMFDSLQRTLASISGIFMIDTCLLLLKRISLLEFAPLGVLSFKHHLQEIM